MEGDPYAQTSDDGDEQTSQTATQSQKGANRSAEVQKNSQDYFCDEEDDDSVRENDYMHSSICVVEKYLMKQTFVFCLSIMIKPCASFKIEALHYFSLSKIFTVILEMIFERQIFHIINYGI